MFHDQCTSSRITSKITTHATVTDLLTQLLTELGSVGRQQAERKDLVLKSHQQRLWKQIGSHLTPGVRAPGSSSKQAKEGKERCCVKWPGNGRDGVAQRNRVTLHCLVRRLIIKMTQSAHQVEQEHDTSSKTDNGFATIRTQTQVSGYFPAQDFTIAKLTAFEFFFGATFLFLFSPLLLFSYFSRITAFRAREFYY